MGDVLAPRTRPEGGKLTDYLAVHPPDAGTAQFTRFSTVALQTSGSNCKDGDASGAGSQSTGKESGKQLDGWGRVFGERVRSGMRWRRTAGASA